MNNIEIAEAFFVALASEDERTLRALCTPTAAFQQNGGQHLNLEQLLGFAKLVHKAAEGFQYGTPACSATPGGFVQEHFVRGHLKNGKSINIPVCVVGDIRDGKIASAREYFDSVAGTDLLAALST